LYDKSAAGRTEWSSGMNHAVCVDAGTRAWSQALPASTIPPCRRTSLTTPWRLFPFARWQQHRRHTTTATRHRRPATSATSLNWSLYRTPAASSTAPSGTDQVK